MSAPSAKDWFLIHSEDDNSHSRIHRMFVLNAGHVKSAETVTFFYRNKPCVGTVISVGGRSDIDEELKMLGVEAKRTSKAPDECSGKRDSLAPASSKRLSVPPVKYGEPSAVSKSAVPNPKSRRKRSREEIDRVNLQQQNKKMGEADGNDKVLGWLKRGDDSADKHGDGTNFSDSDDSDTLLNFNANNQKKQRDALVKGIKAIEPESPPQRPASAEAGSPQRPADAKAKSPQGPAAAEPKSPTREEYKALLLQAQWKIKALTDAEVEKDSDSIKDESVAQEKSFEKAKESHGDDNSSEKNSSFNHDQHSANDGDNLSVDEEMEDLKLQLYGSGPDMILLKSGIYVKRNVLKAALNSSTNVAHVARRLLVGVFKPEPLLKCTLTGQQWRAGPNTSGELVQPLYKPAVDAIIEYAKSVGEQQRNWTKKNKFMDDSKIKHSMSQRLGELKRSIKAKGIEATIRPLLL
ncbi:hypothetical protein ONE63_011585 [Megalurothrips usitatus]|uniref:BEN domain-containing protein n=1 Tax=Megalurothrips usitatus TaxID=439358 RepID=A0AAV7X1H4_9NEOP|nr:hypothetical protein ONE63_011585 [Megalurothrips usitatus]